MLQRLKHSCIESSVSQYDIRPDSVSLLRYVFNRAIRLRGNFLALFDSPRIIFWLTVCNATRLEERRLVASALPMPRYSLSAQVIMVIY